MTQQHRTTRTVYRAAAEHLAGFGGTTADETWREPFDGPPEPHLMRSHEETIADVAVVVELSDDLDSVERVRADGIASLHFPIVDDVGQALTLCPGDLPTIRAALDAIEREWTRLGVYPAEPATLSACTPGPANS